MAINQVQFQKRLSMAEFPDRYGTEEKCHAALVPRAGRRGSAMSAANTKMTAACEMLRTPLPRAFPTTRAQRGAGLTRYLAMTPVSR